MRFKKSLAILSISSSLTLLSLPVLADGLSIGGLSIGSTDSDADISADLGGLSADVDLGGGSDAGSGSSSGSSASAGSDSSSSDGVGGLGGSSGSDISADIGGTSSDDSAVSADVQLFRRNGIVADVDALGGNDNGGVSADVNALTGNGTTADINALGGARRGVTADVDALTGDGTTANVSALQDVGGGATADVDALSGDGTTADVDLFGGASEGGASVNASLFASDPGTANGSDDGSVGDGTGDDQAAAPGAAGEEETASSSDEVEGVEPATGAIGTEGSDDNMDRSVGDAILAELAAVPAANLRDALGTLTTPQVRAVQSSCSGSISGGATRVCNVLDALL